MSRPESLTGTSGREAIGPTRAQPAGSGSVPLRVVAERLSAEEARAAEQADAERRAYPGAARTAVLSAVGSVANASPLAPPLAPSFRGSPPPGTAALPSTGALTPAAAPGLPVPLATPLRRSGLADLLALVTGRRSQSGRHRPDCVRRQSWTMFSPQRRPSRRRRRFRDLI